MTIMKVVKKFHEEIIYEKHVKCSSKHQTACDCIECCSKPYFDDIAIDYTCEQKRKIYVIRYLPAYISEIHSALRRTGRAFINNLLQFKEISVVSIGGGPGTDIAAFNKWIKFQYEEDDKLETINYLRLDINNDWGEISPEIIHLYKLNNVTYNFKKKEIDFSKDNFNSKNFTNFNVAIISYLISEIESKHVEYIAKNLKNILSDNSLIIINDRPQRDVISKIGNFTNILGETDIGIIEPSDRDHCGESYPDAIYDQAKPTIFKKSIRYNILVRK